MSKLISVLLMALVFALTSTGSFAISPGAGQAQTQNNMQEMQRNQQRMKQMQQNKVNYPQKKKNQLQEQQGSYH